ncbi:hypothetical protein thsrh120_28450 [Rhizobium sp. No.120]
MNTGREFSLSAEILAPVRVSFSKAAHKYDFWIRVHDSQACGAGWLSKSLQTAATGADPVYLIGEPIPCG